MVIGVSGSAERRGPRAGSAACEFGEGRAEVGVFRDEDALFICGKGEDLGVLGVMHPGSRPWMAFKPFCLRHLGDRVRVGIEQQPHRAPVRGVVGPLVSPGPQELVVSVREGEHAGLGT